MFFKEKIEPVEEQELFFNPDPLVNRINLIIRLTRELEITEDQTTKEILYDCVKITFKSMKSGEEDVYEVTH